MHLGIEFHTKSMEKHLSNIEKKHLPTAVRVSLNETARNAKSTAVVTIDKDLNKALKQSKIRDKVKNRNVKAKETNIDKMQSRVYAFGSRFGIIDTKNVRQVGNIGRRPKRSRRKIGGVKYKSFSGGTGFRQSAFIATMPKSTRKQISQHKGVFGLGRDADSKSGRDTQGKLKKGRLPIVEQKGPSVPKIFNEKSTERALLKRADTDFPKILERQIRMRLKRAGLRR